MIRRNKHILLLITILGCFYAGLAAQSGTASPYSMYGLGEINDLTSGRVAGKGHVSLGMRSSQLVNQTNPASYTAFDSLAFVFDVSIAGKASKFSSGLTTDKARSANIYKMNFGFRINPRWATSLGLLPFSSVGYSMASTTQVEGSNRTGEVLYTGSGGITRLLWGNAFQITPAWSVGFNSSFLFGSLISTEEQSTWSIEKIARTHKFYVDFGMQYVYPVNPRLHAVIGAVYGYKSRIVFSNDIEISSLYSTIFTEKKRNTTLYLPEFYGIGVSLVGRNNVVVAADYMTKKWSVMPSKDGAVFKDTHRINVGASIVPDAKMPKSYFDLIEYQVGASVGNSYLSFNGKNAMQYAFTLGAGLPVGNSIVDVVYEYGVSGRTGYKQLQEKYHKITIGITLREIWFYKMLYQ